MGAKSLVSIFNFRAVNSYFYELAHFAARNLLKKTNVKHKCVKEAGPFSCTCFRILTGCAVWKSGKVHRIIILEQK